MHETEITTRARWARRALRDAGIEVSRAESEATMEAAIFRRRSEHTPLWCARCDTITAHIVDRGTLVDVCLECSAPAGDGPDA